MTVGDVKDDDIVTQVKAFSTLKPKRGRIKLGIVPQTSYNTNSTQVPVSAWYSYTNACKLSSC